MHVWYFRGWLNLESEQVYEYLSQVSNSPGADLPSIIGPHATVEAKCHTAQSRWFINPVKTI